MPNVSAVNNTTAGATSQTQTTGNSSLGKDEFLNLLVTQLRYQDPMEPMKDTDFVAQLAQFSSLEQLSSINSNLDTSSQLSYALSQTIANTMATTLIGKEVIATGNEIDHNSGHNDNLHFNLGADAATAEVKVYDSNGTLVRTIEAENLQSGLNSVNWDGKDDSGVTLSAGTYTFEVTAKNHNGESVTADTRRVGVVDSVRYENGQGYLIIDGQKISLSDIIEINTPGSSSMKPNNNG
jgi:flagellar basal-body rod modification protein FlgD